MRSKHRMRKHRLVSKAVDDIVKNITSTHADSVQMEVQNQESHHNVFSECAAMPDAQPEQQHESNEGQCIEWYREGGENLNSETLCSNDVYINKLFSVITHAFVQFLNLDFSARNQNMNKSYLLIPH